MNVIALNGSPRKNWNTATLLKKVLEGAVAAGAETDLLHLYDLDFKGCTSCFAVQRNIRTPGFSTLGEAREWALSFVRWYNYSHHHSGIGFVTPHERHIGEALTIMKNRKKVYEAVKFRNPQRWSSNTRNWRLPETVWLNPEKKAQKTAVK
jgi:hypothetical protein